MARGPTTRIFDKGQKKEIMWVRTLELSFFFLQLDVDKNQLNRCNFRKLIFFTVFLLWFAENWESPCTHDKYDALLISNLLQLGKWSQYHLSLNSKSSPLFSVLFFFFFHPWICAWVICFFLFFITAHVVQSKFKSKIIVKIFSKLFVTLYTHLIDFFFLCLENSGLSAAWITFLERITSVRLLRCAGSQISNHWMMMVVKQKKGVEEEERKQGASTTTCWSYESIFWTHVARKIGRDRWQCFVTML